MLLGYRLWCEPKPPTHEVSVESMFVRSLDELGLLRLCVSRYGLWYTDTDRSWPFMVPPTGQLLALQVLSVLVLELLCKCPCGETFGDSRELSSGTVFDSLVSSGETTSGETSAVISSLNSLPNLEVETSGLLVAIL